MWQLADPLAKLSLPALSAEINTFEPWQGIRSVSLGSGRSVAASVLQIDVRELVAANRLPLEVYTRGSDLVATYAASETRNIQTQIYWRAVDAASSYGAAGLELILSAQTHLLDSRPTLTTQSVLPTGPVLGLSGDSAEPLREVAIGPSGKMEFDAAQPMPLFLFQPQGADYSYLEMVQPSDYAGASLERRGETLRLVNQLFPERLEKGVIRRARLCGLFLPRANDVEHALTAYRAFINEPLPLTT
jgi:hypothetical protein